MICLGLTDGPVCMVCHVRLLRRRNTTSLVPMKKKLLIVARVGAEDGAVNALSASLHAGPGECAAPIESEVSRPRMNVYTEW